MTIAASVPQTVSFRADLLPATPALAQIAGRGPRLDQSSSIGRAALDCIYLLNRRRSSEHTISSTRRHSENPAAKSKSP